MSGDVRGLKELKRLKGLHESQAYMGKVRR